MALKQATLLKTGSFLPLSVIALCLIGSGRPAAAQGIGEYGGVMGMPRPVPTGHASAVQNLFQVPSLGGGAAPTAGSSGAGQPVVGDSRVIAKNVADKANAYFNEAQKKEKAGKISEAEALYRSSATWRERVWGTKDPAVFVIYGKIGALCTKQNKLAEAEAAYRHQVTCAVRLYGAGAYEAVPVLSNLAETCVAENKWADAVSTYRQVYQLRKRKLGASNAETLDAMLKLAHGLKQTDCPKEAESLAKEGATLAGASEENAHLVQAFNEVINPQPGGAAAPAQAGQSQVAPANTPGVAPQTNSGAQSPAASAPAKPGSEKSAEKSMPAAPDKTSGKAPQ